LDETAKQFGVPSVEVKEKLGNLCRLFQREHMIVYVYDNGGARVAQSAECLAMDWTTGRSRFDS
jgi:hypothetical protein